MSAHRSHRRAYGRINEGSSLIGHKQKEGKVFYAWPDGNKFDSKQRFINHKKWMKQREESQGGNNLIQQCAKTGRVFVNDNSGYTAWVEGIMNDWLNEQAQMVRR